MGGICRTVLVKQMLLVICTYFLSRLLTLSVSFMWLDLDL